MSENSLIQDVVRFFRSYQLDPAPWRHAAAGYNRSFFCADVKAGFNVALLAFPQGMAYAAIAGLPIQYGIYGSAIACLFGMLLAGSRFIMLGPTNATSVLLFSSFLALGITDNALKVQMLPLILLFAGVFLIIGSFLKIATLIQYVSRPVATGYISAAAIYIIVNQTRKIFGYSFEIPENSTFFDIIYLTIVNLPQTHWNTALLSFLTAIVFFVLNRRMPKLPNVAITLIAMSFVAWLFNTHIFPDSGMAMLVAVDATQWPVGIPELRFEWISDLAGVALVIAFLSVLEGSSIGRSLAARAGARLDTNQEMLSMGLANVGCAFFGGMPASGSLTRSQLAWTSGGQTQFTSLFCGLILAGGVFIIGGLIKFIPVASLGVLVVAIGVSLINVQEIKLILRTTRSDAVTFWMTFIAALVVRLDFAIMIGVFASILLFLRKAATPEMVEYSFTEEGNLARMKKQGERADPEVSIVHVEGDLFFGAAELFREQMRRICHDPNLKIVILKMRNARHIDATSILGLGELLLSMNQMNRYLVLCEVREELKTVLARSGLLDTIGKENVIDDHPDNTVLSAAMAVKRAKQLLGDQEARVSIYVDSAKRKPPSEREKD